MTKKMIEMQQTTDNDIVNIKVDASIGEMLHMRSNSPVFNNGSKFRFVANRNGRKGQREANLKLKPSKCIFFQKQVKFLGHIVSSLGIQTDTEKISVVKNWPIPKNERQIRSFLGLSSYYRRFVKNFAEIAKPLHDLYKKKTKFFWTPECQNAFDTLKTALTTSPILRFPLPGLPSTLDTDASDKAVGAVLSQNQEGKERVIA
ncbi:uncharacterized protein LOC133182844 [Saccostrea echinata]|uniref:uncharacterized protein LOC133182844 n=1 Tax=Saccostrea echinata TaxID=191078 RepID=UPI002A804D50|nr:uncharacterized protein LOC133182844 [Saccostrea echinata]